ncbi:MAG: two-component system response regulator [Candidatus Competibacter denitrificans]
MTIESLAGERPMVLVVDDALDCLSLLGTVLKGLYRVKIANGGQKALDILASVDLLDLILLDIMMPGIDGYEICTRLKNDQRTRDIPIIFLTAKTDIEDEEKGLGLGAVDYITKPISPPIVMARVKAQLQIKAAADFLRDKNAYLEQIVDKRTQEVRAIQEVMLFGLASLAETRDNETGNHIRRTQHYIKALAEHLRCHPRFQSFISDYTIAMLFRSAPLHDIGKVGIPDGILLKPGRFVATEYKIMKAHTSLGRDAIENAEKKLGFKVDFLRFAKEIAYSHHEKWDGTGYPQKLAGEAIPISARLMAIADIYDAIVNRRIYKEPFSHDDAAEFIKANRGSHFDPDITDAFLAIQDEFKAIAERFADGT